ncbi:hypothetical protein [Streptomyces sp. NPDC056682]|uniref:hypothetical protein n=1 Tax=Streptomyces sp. NPDC056682 TaxID=3345909 RepID=UPI003697C7AF
MVTVAHLQLRDLADGWHLCVALGLTTSTAAHLTDALAALLVVAAWHAGHHRSAVTLAATTVSSAAVSAYLL